EAVPQGVLGPDVARLVCVVPERGTQLRDRTGEYPGSDVAVAPHAVEQLVTPDQLTAMAQQLQQYRERFRLDRQRNAVPAEGMRCRIDQHAVEAVALANGATGPPGYGRVHRGNLMLASPCPMTNVGKDSC